MRIAVLGDIVADLYITGTTDRVSREAPIIIVRQQAEELIPGGAANVARNITALGAHVELVGVVGDDDLGEQLRHTLADCGVGTTGVIASGGAHTTAKTRIVAGASHTAPQQVLRIDREPRCAPSAKTARAVAAAVRRIDRKVHAWMVSDYGYRLVTPPLRQWFAKAAETKPVLADSRYDILNYRNLTAVKPNEREALEAAGIETSDRQALIEAARIIRRRTGSRAVIITLGNEGMLVYRGRAGHRLVPAVGTDQIVDLTGAGDTAGAALIVAIAAGADLYQAAALANCAASVVVMKQGCACCTGAELNQAVQTFVPHE